MTTNQGTAGQGVDQGQGASFGPGARASHHAASGVDGPSGFDPERVGGVTAPNYDPQYEAHLMLPRLIPAQRDFILRAKPHTRDQHLSATDFRTVEPCVELMDWPPHRIWFGGMRATSGAGQRRWKRTFRFNAAGMLLRAAIARAEGMAQ